MNKLSVAVIGCGIVARSRYFPALHALDDLFDVRALCDTDPSALEYAHRLFPRAGAHAHHGDLFTDHAHELDAVILLTGGDHTDLLDDLARHRLPTLTEKPLAYTRAAAQRISDVFAGANVPLQVGYMKRHYPGVSRLQDVLATDPVATVTIDLVHPPEDTYLTPVIGHGRAVTGDLPSFLDTEAARPDVSQALADLGVTGPHTCARRGYVLLATSVIHDINLLRALLGDPVTVPFAHFWNGGLSGRAVLAWAEDRTACLTYSYVETGGYTETVNLITPTSRWTLDLPSPYLPHAPAVLHTLRGATTGLPITTTDPVSLDDPFHSQLRAFHHTAGTGTTAATDGADATADLALIEGIITAATQWSPELITANNLRL